MNFNNKLLSRLVWYLAVLGLYAAHAENDNHGSPQQHGSNDDDSAVPDYYTFISGPGIRVHVIPNFLPLSLAQQWRRVLRQEWDKRATDNHNSAWEFATNNNGQQALSAGNNQKTKGLENIALRNQTARLWNDHGMFAYSKWELPRHHALVTEIERAFLKDDDNDSDNNYHHALLKRRIQQVILHAKKGNHREQPPQPQKLSVDFSSEELSDLFVTYYGTGNFLSPHTDGFSGSWAFVVSLMDHPFSSSSSSSSSNDTTATPTWNESWGGLLRFACEYPLDRRSRRQRGGVRVRPPGPEQWCQALAPSFNTAVIFQTRPMGPLHEVTPVSYQAEQAGFYRFSFTGWYLDRADEMSDVERVERDKMRGEALKKDEL